MAQEKHTIEYRINRVDDEKTKEPEQMQRDPLDDLPDLSEQTGGIPVVTFVLIGLAGCSMMLLARLLAAESALVAVGCIVFLIVLICGMIVLFRGMFDKLRREQAEAKWYTISAVVMSLGIAAGLICGTVIAFF